ncbi:MAG: hypothetical protein QXJ02_07540, partial [Candidatus Bathyarchaeia archaeon]
NEAENKTLLQMKKKQEFYFEAQGCGSPITLLQGRAKRQAVETAARLTAYYSDNKSGLVRVKFGKANLDRELTVAPPSREEVEKLRV